MKHLAENSVTSRNRNTSGFMISRYNDKSVSVLHGEIEGNTGSTFLDFSYILSAI